MVVRAKVLFPERIKPYLWQKVNNNAVSAIHLTINTHLPEDPGMFLQQPDSGPGC
jgi:hypothetical protein